MVKINSVVVEALIDSGSARSLIKRNFANNLKEKCFVRLKGFAGGEYECFELTKSNIVIDDVCVDSNLLIIDDSKLDYDVLVGRDVLCANGNIFEIDGQDCWIAINPNQKDLQVKPINCDGHPSNIFCLWSLFQHCK